MTVLFRKAWQLGWLRFINDGKLPAVLFAALLLLWISGRWKRQKALFSCTALMALLCVVPVTAVVLMLYQTRFYDYEWLWSLVPMTVTAAWGITELLNDRWKDFSFSQWRQGLPVTILLLAVLALCGSFGGQVMDRKAEADRRAQAVETVARVLECRDGDICLWAPREVLEYARQQSGALRLVYGRNMWQESLNAYAYDTYPEQIRELYLWMENTDSTGMALVKDMEQGELVLRGEECMAAAVEAGASCILLPEILDAETVDMLAEAVGGTVVRLEQYYLVTR